MPWRTITADDCKFTPAEMAVLQNIQGGTDGLQTRLDDTVGEFIGALNAAGYPTVADGSVPDQLRGHILSRTQWQFLADFPMLKSMLTDARKDSAKAADDMLSAIMQRKAGAMEAPAGTVSSAGNWNSENRLILRTHPAPPASRQFSPGQNAAPYANPDGPDDN